MIRNRAYVDLEGYYLTNQRLGNPRGQTTSIMLRSQNRWLPGVVHNGIAAPLFLKQPRKQLERRYVFSGTPNALKKGLSEHPRFARRLHM